MEAEPRVRVLTGVAEVEAVRPAWQRLVEAQGPPATIFQTPDWILSMMRFLVIDNGGAAARIAVVEGKDELIMIAPLALVERSHMRVLQWLGEPLLAYGDVVARRGCDVAQVMEQVIERLQQAGDRIDVIHLPKVRADAVVSPYLEDLAGEPLHRKDAPYLDLASFPNFDAYLASRSKTAMKGYRRKRRRLEELGRLDFQVHPAGAHAEVLARQAIDLKFEWMKVQGKVSRVFAEPAFLHALLHFIGSESSGAFVSELRLNDRPLALEIGFVANGHYYSYIGAMDLEYGRYSPGQLQILDTLRWCFDRGIKVFDLLPPDSDYKRSWATDSAQQNEWVLSCSLKGGLYKNVILKGVKPLSRHIFTSAPLAIRKPAQEFVQRMLRR